MTGWAALWAGRQPPPGTALADLMAADGLDSGFAGVAVDAWSAGVRRIAAQLGLGAGSSVYEVGCGAGAFLYDLEQLGCTVGGVDLAPALVARAREALPGGRFEVGEATEFAVEPRYHAVVSLGVFLYFPSYEYAELVLDRMVAKARTVVAVLDVPDLRTRDVDLARRVEQAGGQAAYDERYRDLDHRYYDREWFAAALRARGVVDVTVADQEIDGYRSAPYRFNVWGRVGSEA